MPSIVDTHAFELVSGHVELAAVTIDRYAVGWHMHITRIRWRKRAMLTVGRGIVEVKTVGV